VQPIADADKTSVEVIQELSALDEAIKTKLMTGAESIEETEIPDYLRLHDEDEDASTPQFDPIEPEAAMPEADEFDVEAYDEYLAAEVILPKGENMVLGKVVGCKRDLDGNPIGKGHSNPIFDTRLYQVQFPNGHIEEYSANVIAQNIYSELDTEGHRYILLDSIIDYDKGVEALPPEQRYSVAASGNIHKCRTTKGWRLCVQWKDGSTSWEPLKDMKESFPVQVAEFAISQGIQDEAAFTWWVKDVLKRKNRIIKAMKQARTIRKTHKYGIQVPRSVKEAYELDQETGTDYWHQSILKEMKNNAAAFRFLEPDESIPVGSTWIPCHMIFDVKMDLTRKARYVAGGHWTDPPS
jgi:hypothetical protein